jgi:hypothetical protein
VDAGVRGVRRGADRPVHHRRGFLEIHL